VIARLDRKLTLPDGREAFSVAPDVVVKTPGLPGGERPSDVVLRLDAADYFHDPGIAPFDAREPLYRLTEVGEAARLPLVFGQLGASGLAVAQDAKGSRFIDYRAIARAADGREQATRCVFRLDGDRLRNIGFGAVEMAPDGARVDQHWTDLEHGELYDRLSAKRSPFPPNTYGTPCIAIAIAGFPSEKSQLVRFYLSSGAADLVAAYAQREGDESIEARGRTERAFRVRLGIDVRRSAALVDIPDNFRDYAEASSEGWYVGDSTYWLAAGRPHEVLRFRGLLGPPGAPDVLIERIR
jgi:hypothetical protein